jgi:hypothetical protein
MGYADTGLDADTYNPLCNFTCSHGYCPSPNACLFSITINPDEENTIPTLTEFDNSPVDATYSPGDFFTYVSEENPDLSLDVILLDSADLGNVTCDDGKYIFFILKNFIYISFIISSHIRLDPVLPVQLLIRQ